jgi:hypothetical protein
VIELSVVPQGTKAPKACGSLLILSAIMGIGLLALDNVLRTAALHYYVLIAFVIVDIAVAIYVLARPVKMTFWIAILWCIVRIILQFADLSQASVYQFSGYGQFADYLFNPVSNLSVSLGNPLGVPGLLIDIILILELAVIAIAWRLSHSVLPQSNMASV